MPLAIAQLDDDDPRIHTVRGGCGCIFRTTSVRWPQILAGATPRVFLTCRTCNKDVPVEAYDADKPRYCSSERCAHPTAPLSRYNNDPESRCSGCQHRDREEWLDKLRNPHGAPRDAIRRVLGENEQLTAVQIERLTGIDVAKVYKHLVDMQSQGQVEKRRPKKQLAVYRLAANEMAVAA